MTEEAGTGTAGRRSYPKGVRRRQQILQTAIALFGQRGVERASLRTVGEAIGVSDAALRHYFSSRDELLVEVYRTHEALKVGGSVPADESAIRAITNVAERNRSIPGLVELYATLITDALQARPHPGVRTRWLRRCRPRCRTANGPGALGELVQDAPALRPA